MGDALLSAVGLGHRYGGQPYLFRGLDIVLNAGRPLAVLGPNGQGKTTLLSILAGVRAPAEGRVERRRGVRAAYVPQAHRGGLAYRALDMALMGRAEHVPMLGWPGAEDRRRAAAALERAGAAHLAERPFHVLSGGEKSLVLIARAIASEAEAMILDEPFAALDLANQQRVLSLLLHLARADGVACIVTTHQPQHALALGGDALVLDPDLGAVQGTAREVLDEALLSRTFRLPVARLAVTRDGRTCEVAAPLLGAEIGDSA